VAFAAHRQVKGAPFSLLRHHTVFVLAMTRNAVLRLSCRSQPKRNGLSWTGRLTKGRVERYGAERGDDGGYREKNSFRDSAEAVNRKDQLSKRQQLRQPNGTRQMNAVLATFKAGIAPSRIAGQFGISQSDVRRVLALDSRTSGKGR
jgi:hypothetical protein